jgi:hypothetical protein
MEINKVHYENVARTQLRTLGIDQDIKSSLDSQGLKGEGPDDGATILP